MKTYTVEAGGRTYHGLRRICKQRERKLRRRGLWTLRVGPLRFWYCVTGWQDEVFSAQDKAHYAEKAALMFSPEDGLYAGSFSTFEPMPGAQTDFLLSSGEAVLPKNWRDYQLSGKTDYTPAALKASGSDTRS